MINSICPTIEFYFHYSNVDRNSKKSFGFATTVIDENTIIKICKISQIYEKNEIGYLSWYLTFTTKSHFSFHRKATVQNQV